MTHDEIQKQCFAAKEGTITMSVNDVLALLDELYAEKSKSNVLKNALSDLASRAHSAVARIP